MHYRNGREAKNGDRVIQLSFDGAKIVSLGILHGAVPGTYHPATGSIAPVSDQAACLVDCLHADDLAAILAEKGLDKRPAGK